MSSAKIKVCACGHAKGQHYSGCGGCKGCSGCSHFRYDGAKTFAAQKGGAK